MRVRPITILLVEDNMDHIELTVTALRNNGLINKINIVTDGQEALDYLYGNNKYSDRNEYPYPELILLDIKLPKVDGFEVLKTLKNDSELRKIPVVILTTSDNDKDITCAYMNGANSYISKPVNFDEFHKKINDLKIYWVLTNTLPRT